MYVSISIHACNYSRLDIYLKQRFMPSPSAYVEALHVPLFYVNLYGHEHDPEQS
jgi:hypothetical protein